MEGKMTARILVVDNYDSFVFNLVQYLQQLGADTEVLRNDEVTVEQALETANAATERTLKQAGYIK